MAALKIGANSQEKANSYRLNELFYIGYYDVLSQYEEDVTLLLMGNSDARIKSFGMYFLKKISAIRQLVTMHREMLTLVCDNIKFYRKGREPVFGSAKESERTEVDALNKKMEEIRNRIDAHRRDIVSIVLKEINDKDQENKAKETWVAK